MDYSGSLPKKKQEGPQRFEEDHADLAPYSPEWEDLTPEEQALYGSPMKYARRRLDSSINAKQIDPNEDETY